MGKQSSGEGPDVTLLKAIGIILAGAVLVLGFVRVVNGGW